LTLNIRGLKFTYGKTEVLKGIDLTVERGVTSFIGPNAAGKSTLMKCIAGLLKPSGFMEMDGNDLVGRRDKNAIGTIAYMPQEMPDKTSLTVMEVMLMGRLDSLKWKVGDDDIKIAYDAMEDLGITDIAPRPMNELSGGQNQIVMVAQCLVRDPKLLLMDEPINNLDLQKQLEMFDIIERVTEEREFTTVMVLHDINFAARYSDRIIVLSNGLVYSSGTPAEVVTEQMIREVYGVESSVHLDNEGIPHVHPLYSVRFGKRLRS
jgi:iron complex transport system ATP-binding protein